MNSRIKITSFYQIVVIVSQGEHNFEFWRSKCCFSLVWKCNQIVDCNQEIYGDKGDDYIDA